jgi:hypothetical protein
VEKSVLLEGIKSTFCGIIDIYGALGPDKQSETAIPLQEEADDKLEMEV